MMDEVSALRCQIQTLEDTNKALAEKLNLAENDRFVLQRLLNDAKEAFDKAVGAPENVFEKPCCGGAYGRGYALGHYHGRIGYTPPTGRGRKNPASPTGEGGEQSDA